jgi:3-methylcrotonyl-CoA carboxylase alpha subunit
MAQEDIGLSGHAFEARLYAEDPRHDFRPSTGRISHLRLPASDGRVTQIDTGVREGDRVTIHYDPMIAKVTVWGESRPVALRRLAAALAECEIAGVVTNAALLGRLAKAPEIAAGAVDTGYIGRHAEALRAPHSEHRALSFVAAGLCQLPVIADCAGSADLHSPWCRNDGWRLGGHEPIEMLLADEEGEEVLRLHRLAGGARVDCAGLSVEAELLPGRLAVNGCQYRLNVARDGDRTTVFLDGETYAIARRDPFALRKRGEEAEGGVVASMPGTIVAVLVQEGQAVTRGQRLVVLEAMKMEIALAAPADGIVESLLCKQGDMVEEGAPLVRFKAGEKK